MAKESIEERREKIKQLLQHFDNIFETDTTKDIDLYFNNITMIQNVYEMFEEDFVRTDQEYEKIRRNSIQVSDILDKTFTEAQQTLFEKYWELEMQMGALENEKMFYFGYLMSKVLDQGIKIENKEN